MRITRKTGFSVIELLIIIVVVAVIGLLGYVAYTTFQNKDAQSSEQAREQSSTASDVKTAPAIESSSDLTDAETILDQTDPDASIDDVQQLDNDAATF